MDQDSARSGQQQQGSSTYDISVGGHYGMSYVYKLSSQEHRSAAKAEFPVVHA